MTSDDRGWSLAEQAANWVPPWERAAPERPEPPAPDGPPDEPADEVSTEPADEVPPETLAVPPVEVPSVEVPSVEVPPVEVPPEPVDGPLAEPADEVSAEPPAEPAAEVSAEPAPPGQLALAGDAELRGALEAILLVVEEPVSEVMLAQVLEQPTDRITTLLAGLAEEYTASGRGFELRRVAGGWRLYTRPGYASYVERFVLDGQQLRLTQAALETLAVVAYKQPVTRSRVSAIRGVNCDGVIRTLVSRGLVEECGAEPDNGAYLYRTTTLFLEKLGLNSVEELPPLAPFLPDDVDEIADAPH